MHFTFWDWAGNSLKTGVTGYNEDGFLQQHIECPIGLKHINRLIKG